MIRKGKQKNFSDNDSIFLPQLNFRTNLVEGNDGHLHSHDFIEFFYIISGSISHSCNEETSTLSTGDAVLIFPKVQHRFKRTEPCLYRNFCITIEEFKICCSFLGENVFKAVSAYNHIPAKLELHTIDFLESQVKYVSRHLSEEDDAVSKIKMLTVVTINCFFRNNDPFQKSSFKNNGVDVVAPQWFLDILTLFDKYDVIKYGIPELKKYIFYSYSYVCRSFNKYLGKSLLNYLNEIRLEHSKYLLRNTRYSILEIANNIGFSSVGYYNKIFKKYYNITPTAYRKKSTCPQLPQFT